jgi:hypothetical protein
MGYRRRFAARAVAMDRMQKDQRNATQPLPAPAEAASGDFSDPVIEAYKKDVDRTLLRENLKLSVAERFQKFERFMEYVYGLRAAGRRARE